MTYEEIVEKVRATYENSDAREIFEHIAVQVNITGEGSGIFYIEVAERHISVEPYDYYDRDALIEADSQVIIDIADGKLTFDEAYRSGALRAIGNHDKLLKLKGVKIKFPAKKKKTKKQ